MTDEDRESLIMRYHSGQLTAAERQELERRLADEPAFAQEVLDHGPVWEAIRREGNARLRQRLGERGRALDAQRARKRRVQAGGVLLVALLLAVGLIAGLAKKRQPDRAVPAAPKEEVPAGDSVALPPPVPAPPRQPAVPAPSRAVSTQQVFAQWFEPYHDESLALGIRGDGEPTPEERFRQLYWDKAYAEALASFDSLADVSKESGNIRFLYANCLLYANKAQEATEVLRQLAPQGQMLYKAHVTWYWALGLLAEGRGKEARRLLRQLQADDTSPYQAEARRLLALLEG